MERSAPAVTGAIRVASAAAVPYAASWWPFDLVLSEAFRGLTLPEVQHWLAIPSVECRATAFYAAPLVFPVLAAAAGSRGSTPRRSLARTKSNRGRIGKALAGYSAWHPNGQVVAYSANDISQFFHAVGEVRDVLDSESDLAMYHVDSDTVSTCPRISPSRSAWRRFRRGRPTGVSCVFAGPIRSPRKSTRRSGTT